MNARTKRIAVCAVMTALSVICVYLGAVIATNRLSLTALTTVFTAAAVIESGRRGGLYVFVATLILGLTLIPDKALMILYAAFFGYYPVLKSISEALRSRLAEWVLKLVVFNSAFAFMWLLFKGLFFSAGVFEKNAVLVFSALNVIFIVFDIGLSRLIYVYSCRISENLK